MKIRSHHESHIVELTNGSRWEIFPGDLDLTLHWKPESELRVEPFDDGISSHELVDEVTGHRVRVIPAHRDWPVREVKRALKDEQRLPKSASAAPRKRNLRSPTRLSPRNFQGRFP